MSEALNPIRPPKESAARARGLTPGTGRDAGRWSVSTRAIGEVLTTDIRCDGLRMLLFSKPSERTAREVERRLMALFEVQPSPTASEDGETSAPALLHRAVVLLRGLVAEAERATERPAGAVALYYSRNEIACACLGGGETDVWSHGKPFNAPWFAVSPGSPEPSRASSRIRLFSLKVHSDLDMRLRWPCLLEGASPEGVIVDATWKVLPGLSVVVRSMTGSTLYASRDEDTAATAGTGDARGEFFAGWFDDLKPEGDAAEGAEETQVEEEPAARFADLVSELREHVEADAEAIAALPPETASFESIVSELREQVSDAGDGDVSEPDESLVSADDPVVIAAPVECDSAHALVPATSVADPAWVGALADAATVVEADPPVIVADPPSVGALESTEDIADPPSVGAPGARAIRRPAWPAFTPARRMSRRAIALWVAVPAVLFAIGWWVGVRDESPADVTGRAPGFVRILRAVGIGAARFDLQVTSTPSGAGIAVDGRRTSLRTPATFELAPGPHRLSVLIPELGQVNLDVVGDRNQHRKLDVPLFGALHILAPDVVTPIAITLDGEPRGYAPLHMTNLDPGTHELEYSTPGQPPWSETVRIPVRGDVSLVARPFELPATGLIQVRASVTDDEGVRDLNGAQVWVDGVRAGTTPIDLELTRGPHSLRVEHRGEQSAVQVIDLPGGNQRFASFSFGVGGDQPRPVQQAPTGIVTPDVPTPVTVSIPGAGVSDIREAWLHVRAQDGAWRRYPMKLLPGEAGVVAVVVFPATLLDVRGNALYYVSALGSTGEEYYTEMRDAGPPPARPATPTVRRPATRSKVNWVAPGPASTAPTGPATDSGPATPPSTPPSTR